MEFQFITLAEAKLQLGIDASDTDDDQLISELISDATAVLSCEINRDVYQTSEALEQARENGTLSQYAIALDNPSKGQVLKRLTKLLVAHFFKHREPVTEENARPVYLTYRHSLNLIRIPTV